MAVLFPHGRHRPFMAIHASLLGVALLLYGLGAAPVFAMLPVEPQGKPPATTALTRYEFEQVEMAVPVRIILYAPSDAAATQAKTAAFARMHELNGMLSDYDPHSELRRLCKAPSEIPIPVGDDLWRVLCHAMQLAQRSNGAFDVTVGPVVRLWRRARRQQRLPSETRLRDARALVGHALVRLDEEEHAVALLRPGMRLDLGGIAKGYIADEALAVLEQSGVPCALVDAGGDMAIGNPPPGEPGWRIGIARLEADGPPSHVLVLANGAIATSGDRWQFVMIDGRRYSHIIDPRTGLGLTDHSSVTIVADDCITADSLASAVSVLDSRQGLELVDKTDGAAAFVVRASQGRRTTHVSSRWKELTVVSVTSVDH